MTIYVTSVELGPPATIAASWTSALRAAPTAPSLNIGATLSVAGTVAVQRYLDTKGLIPAGPVVSGALGAGSASNLYVADGLIYQSYTVTITGSGNLTRLLVGEMARQTYLLNTTGGGGGTGMATDGGNATVDALNNLALASGTMTLPLTGAGQLVVNGTTSAGSNTNLGGMNTSPNTGASLFSAGGMHASTAGPGSSVNMFSFLGSFSPNNGNASFVNVKLLVVNPQLSNSGSPISNMFGIQTAPSIAGTYTGQIGTWIGFQAFTPNGQTPTQITNYNAFQFSNIANGNGLTSGTVTNNGFVGAGITTAAGAGGTAINNSALFPVPSGSSSGNTDSAIKITGNGGALSTKYAIQSTSTAPSTFAGNVGLGGVTTPTQQLVLNSTGVLGFDNGSGSADLFLRRAGFAHLRQGGPDTATPVAQTSSVQGVVAGTSNTAGVSHTIAGSVGTGTGVGGSIIFQVAPAGLTGTAQNALATALTIDSTKKATFAGNVSAVFCSSPEVLFANRPGSPSTGDFCNISDSTTAAWGATITGGGANHVLARYNGTNWTVVGA